MDAGAINLTLAMMELIMRYGVPAAVNIYNTWSPADKERPTIEEIEALKQIAPPESYF